MRVLRPRGAGKTAQYRAPNPAPSQHQIADRRRPADDVRLLSIRQGKFVNRSDWRERGGSPLELLGQIVTLVDNNNPGSFFETIALEQLNKESRRLGHKSILFEVFRSVPHLQK